MYSKRVKDALMQGRPVVLKTDTLYGLVAKSDNTEAVEKVYALKKRDSTKPCIILISSIDQLSDFGVQLSPEQEQVVRKNWPGPISIIFETNKKNISHLTRAGTSLAFRLPKKDNLTKLIESTGPIVAPSANIEGKSPARNVADAQKYFGQAVEYVDEGECTNTNPSKLIRIQNDGSIEQLR